MHHVAGRERQASKIHTTDLFEVAPEPNIAAHIIEQSSHFPWQQKTGRQAERRGRRKTPMYSHSRPSVFMMEQTVQVPISRGTLYVHRNSGVVSSL